MSALQLAWINSTSHNVIPKHLGNKLRDVYSELIVEPIPDHFADLLKQLDAAYDDPMKGPNTAQPAE